MSTIHHREDGRPDSTPAVEPELLDVRAVCALLGGCSARTLYRLCDSGRAPYGLRLGGMRRWRRSELAAWISAGCQPVRTLKARGHAT